MNRVLIDTSALLDVLLCFQSRHQRNRSVASSVAAAIESLIVYERPCLDGPTFIPATDADRTSRFLRYYCDNQAEDAPSRLHELKSFCEVLNPSAVEVESFYNKSVEMIKNLLGPIRDPDDLRAYELYDYLPYHLGEDPTAIECRVTDYSVLDIDSLQLVENEPLAKVLQPFAALLHTLGHPTRASWALPLLRLFYYQAVQQAFSVHFVPHATKSTIALGREAETVGYRRLLAYCTGDFRQDYEMRSNRLLDGLMIAIPLPSLADSILRKCKCWPDILDAIVELRNSRLIGEYRLCLAALIEQLQQLESLFENRRDVESAYRGVQELASHVNDKLCVDNRFRMVRMALPFFTDRATKSARTTNVFMFVHELVTVGSV